MNRNLIRLQYPQYEINIGRRREITMYVPDVPDKEVAEDVWISTYILNRVIEPYVQEPD